MSSSFAQPGSFTQVALAPETGKELWSFDPRLDRTQSANLFINRGAAWWSDGHKIRVMVGTLGGRLFSFVAETGKPDDLFGVEGWVDLRKGIADEFPDRRIGMTSPPAVYKNLVDLRLSLNLPWRCSPAIADPTSARHEDGSLY